MKLDMAAILGALVLFLISLMAGSMWFTLPTPESMESSRRAEQASSPELNARQREIAAAWNARIAQAGRTAADLRRERETAGDELRKLRAANQGKLQVGEAAAEEPARLLAVRQAQVELLGETEPAAAGDARAILAQPIVPAGAQPVLVQIYGGRVIPVDEKHFSVRVIDARGKTYRILTRIAAGETADRALSPGGEIRQLLGVATRAEAQYLQCLVSPDSFEEFRAIRRAAEAARIAVRFEPYQDEDGRVVLERGSAGVER